MVADNDSGKSIASEVRTSSGMFLRKGQVSEIDRCWHLIREIVCDEFLNNLIYI